MSYPFTTPKGSFWLLRRVCLTPPVPTTLVYYRFNSKLTGQPQTVTLLPHPPLDISFWSFTFSRLLLYYVRFDSPPVTPLPSDLSNQPRSGTTQGWFHCTTSEPGNWTLFTLLWPLNFRLWDSTRLNGRTHWTRCHTHDRTTHVLPSLLSSVRRLRTTSILSPPPDLLPFSPTLPLYSCPSTLRRLLLIWVEPWPNLHVSLLLPPESITDLKAEVFVHR